MAEAGPALARPVRHVELALVLSRTVLVDRPALRGDDAVVLTMSRLGGRRRFSAWLTHLLLCACGHAVHTRVWARGGQVAYGPVDADEATGLLERLTQLQGWGLRLPLLWFPEASWTWFGARRLDAVQRGWGRWGEPDEETRRVLGERCPFDPGVDLSDVRIPRQCQAWELAEELWGPVARHTVEGSP